MVPLSPPLDPPILKGIKVHPDNPFRFDFILDQGDSSPVIPAKAGIQNQEQLKSEATRLIKYFFASLTIPEKDLWVNLSPYEKDRIIPQRFGLTEMGRDLLAEDYMLKQITASLIYPEDKIGKKFWKRIYAEAAKKFGTTNVPVNTFNKVWIVPEKAVVYENAKAGTAYVVESKLKVMLEQDYLALEKNSVIPMKSGIQNKNDINTLGSQIVCEIVIPELTKEVNEDKNFAKLRQVYNSLILATWYKKKIKDSLLEQVYADKNKVEGIGYGNSLPLEGIYQRYLQAFKKGVFNYIKEESDPMTQETIPRKYFSGGVDFAMSDNTTMKYIGGVMSVVNTLPDGSSNEAIVTVDMGQVSQKTSFADIWPIRDFKKTYQYLARDKGRTRISLAAGLVKTKAILEEGRTQFSDLNSLKERLLFLFPQYTDDIDQWAKTVKDQEPEEKDTIFIDDTLRIKLLDHFRQHADQIMAFAYAFDFLINSQEEENNNLEEAQNYLSYIDNLGHLEDQEIKRDVFKVIDELGAKYLLEPRQIKEIKKSVLVTKAEDSKDVNNRLKRRLTNASFLLNEFRKGKIRSLAVGPFKKNGPGVMEEIFKQADKLPYIAYEIAEGYLKNTNTSAFGAVTSKQHKHMVFIRPKDGRSGIIAEVGHLFWTYLAGTSITDSSVNETFDSLARIALGEKISYSKIGKRFFNRLKTLNIDKVYKNRIKKDAGLGLIYIWSHNFPEKPRNKTDALMQNPDLVRTMLIEILGSSQKVDLFPDIEIVPHSLGDYLAMRMVKKTGSPQKAIAVVKKMLESPDKGWLNDYEKFIIKFDKQADQAMANDPASLEKYRFKIQGDPEKIPNTEQIRELARNYGDLLTNILERTDNILQKKQPEYDQLEGIIDRWKEFQEKQNQSEDPVVRRFMRTINYHFVLEDRSSNNTDWDLPNRLVLFHLLRDGQIKENILENEQEKLRNLLIYFKYLREAKHIYIIKAIDTDGSIAEAIDPRPGLEGWSYKGKDTQAGEVKNTGGVDFNPDKMNLQVKVDSRFRGNDNGIKFLIDPDMLQQLQDAPGFVPVIINIQPLKNLHQFLGINATN